MTTFAPTPEQEAALAAFATREDLIIEAGAGTGKTATLQLLAESDGNRRGQYIAFNKAIVVEAQERMPGHVNASTAHSLAFRAVGKAYSHRLNGPRMRSAEIARRLGVDQLTVMVGPDEKRLSAEYLAGLVMRAITIFCQSDAPYPTEQHVPYIDGIDLSPEPGKRGWKNNSAVRSRLLPFVERAWQDIQLAHGQLPFRHEHYLKMYELGRPHIGADVIYFDEAQDVSPVLASIVAQQTHAQRVYVGDSNQSIYGFTGAVDAIAQLKASGATVTTLSQSFRFGDAVAAVANRVLETLPTDLRLRGTPSIASVVGPVAEADAILCRTNARAVQGLMDEAERGRRAHLVGGGAEVIGFARGAWELQSRGATSHQDLACFNSWGEVQEYVEQDAQGGELKLLVDLVDRFGAGPIIAALERMPRESDAEVVLSTAHKAKGRQWNAVQLAGDFPDKDPADEEDEAAGVDERRLLYVAVTRARIELDAEAVEWVVAGAGGDAGAATEADDATQLALVECAA